jgi:uncharacterized surface protein with fasciclin (FAS1) repeats
MTFLKSLSVAALLAVAPLSVMPASAANVVETAQEAGTFETLLAAATAAGLAETLATTENITVFAPTDDAFAALPEGTVDTLLLPENQDQLIAILQLHVLGSTVMAGDIADGESEVATLNPDAMLTIEKSATGVTVSASNTATVVTPDVAADNGVIHIIDAVLLP